MSEHDKCERARVCVFAFTIARVSVRACQTARERDRDGVC